MESSAEALAVWTMWGPKPFHCRDECPVKGKNCKFVRSKNPTTECVEQKQNEKFSEQRGKINASVYHACEEQESGYPS